MPITEKIQNIIKGRPCFVVAKGVSLDMLKDKIEDYKDLDVCWVTLNDFHYIEDSILSKIGKKFELVSDCATVYKVDYYETMIRLPRFTEYLGRKNNLLMLSNLVVEQCFRKQKREDLLEKYRDKIITIDELFSSPQCPRQIWNRPPNSITLLYAFLIAGGATKIINFGLDGYQASMSSLESYYMPEAVNQERHEAYGENREASLKTDGEDFNKRWKSIEEIYRISFNNPKVKIYNCSPITTINVFPIINYDQVKETINGN